MAAPYKPISLTPLGEVLADTGVVVMVKNVGEGWVDNANTTYQFPCPFSKCRLVRIGVYVTTVPADAEGDMTYAVIKRQASDDADVAVSAVESAVTLTASEMRQVALAGTVADRTFLNADVLEIDLISDTATIDTDATETTFILEFVLVE